jgi:vitamin B12/bleomycin/antimicrobial peptide transport system ATP-binding/permease protein
MRGIVSATTRLTWVTAGYGWFTIIAPIVVASPGYFGGDLSFGALMMAVGAFVQVQQALRWFIDNFSTIAEWRATLLRIASFREAVVMMDRLGATENRIEFVEAAGETISFENLERRDHGCAPACRLEPSLLFARPHRALGQGTHR